MGERERASETGAARVGWTLLSLPHPAELHALPALSSIQVGTLLGEGKIERAKHASLLGVALNGGYGLLAGGAIFLARKPLCTLFASEAAIAEAAASVCFPVALNYFLQCYQYGTWSVLEAQGRNCVTSTSLVVGTWACAVPLAYVLVQTGTAQTWGWSDLSAIYWALNAGDILVDLIMTVALLRGDWETIAKEAQEAEEEEEAAADEAVLTFLGSLSTSSQGSSQPRPNEDRLKGMGNSLAPPKTPKKPSSSSSASAVSSPVVLVAEAGSPSAEPMRKLSELDKEEKEARSRRSCSSLAFKSVMALMMIFATTALVREERAGGASVRCWGSCVRRNYECLFAALRRPSTTRVSSAPPRCAL